MDFFAAQDLARRNSRLLVLWFILAVAGIVAAVYGAVAAARLVSGGSIAASEARVWDPGLFLVTATAVSALILLGSLYKVLVLARGGGAAVAEGLGGRLVPRATEDPLERRLVNVVEEMAIASGVPAPPAYVLDAESGINAFAAGTGTSEAVVAVTRGTLEQLSRDELQGVIAHEFSHILNGDMRLNLRLIGVLHGILLLTLAGRLLLRSTRRSDKSSGPLLALGAALVGIGYVGVLFGKLIKAAVSRQREYLADAAAVQFTRNPAGIAGALRRIAGMGSEIRHPRAEEASHLFFGSGGGVARLLATHPPIEERIRRVDPGFRPGNERPSTPPPPIPPLQGDRFTPAAFADTVGEPQPAHVVHARGLLEALPAPLMDAAHRPAGARALVFGLLLSRESPVREGQLAALESGFGATTREEARRHAEWFAFADPASRLPLLDLAIPALRELSPEARGQVLRAVDALVAADVKTAPFEYALRRILRHALGGRRARPPMIGSLAVLKTDTARLLALLARAGTASPEAARAAFQAAVALAPQEGPWEMPEDGQLEADAADRALDHLAGTSAAFRRKLVEASAAAVLQDGRVTAEEGELLRAMCEALDCPVPPLVPQPVPAPAPAGAAA